MRIYHKSFIAVTCFAAIHSQKPGLNTPPAQRSRKFLASKNDNYLFHSIEALKENVWD